MGCTIRTKSGSMKLSMGYGEFHYMRAEVLDWLHKGFANIYEWGCSCGCLPGIECDWHIPSDKPEHYKLLWPTTGKDFVQACSDLLYAWLKQNGYANLWNNFFAHPDEHGGWTARQCKSFIKYLDKVKMPCDTIRGCEFNEFREIIRYAAEHNESVKIS